MEPFKRILLIEDSEHDIEFMLDALSEYHLANNIDVVRDGEEAMDYLFCCGKYKGRQSGNPVLAMLDMMLPKMSGLEVLRTMKTDENLRTIPVVALTSSSEESDMFESYRFGVNAYVVKPVEFHSFAEAVKHLGEFWLMINEPPPVMPKG